MKNRLLGFAALGFLLIAFVLAFAPVVRAGGVDDKIQALENELNRLKSEQMELKKDATAAAAALPNFSFRPGNGVLIEAADKAWSIRFSQEFNADMNFESGRAHVGRTDGEIFGRRWRPYIFFCTLNCFYDIEWGVDNDGFGTGNGKNSTNSDTGSVMQRGVAHIHFEQINPWLPSMHVGMDLSNSITTYRQGSGATGAQMEYDLMSRNNGWNTGRAGNGINLRWEDLPLRGIGIPGTMKFETARATFGEGDDGLSSYTSTADWFLSTRIQPFSQVKNKWVSGLGFEFGVWFCNPDRSFGTSGTSDFDQTGTTGCIRNRVQDHGAGGRQTLFEFRPSGFSTAGTGLSSPQGDSQFLIPGIQWNVGPYTLRAIMGFQNFNFVHAKDGSDRQQGIDTKARNFLIGHDLYLWSPKGFLTGSSSTPGSVLVGYHFERNDYSCGHTRPLAMCAEGAQYSRNRIILNEWDAWYWLTNRMSIGVGWLWYDASNLRANATGGSSQVGENLGVFRTRCGTACAGKGGDWLDVIARARLNF